MIRLYLCGSGAPQALALSSESALPKTDAVQTRLSVKGNVQNTCFKHLRDTR